jgi:hypothetical protein
LAKRPAVKVPAEVMFMDFLNNEVGAKQKYGGHNLALDGTVVSVSDTGGGASVELRTPSPGRTISVQFVGAARSAVGQLAAGQRIATRCPSLTSAGTVIFLRDCSVPKVIPDPDADVS